MKKITLIIAVLLSAAFLFSCSQATDAPTHAPAPEPLDIEVMLNNYHIRYFDDDETQFDITVTGKIDSFEIVFLPIETPGATPELDDNGLPSAVGEYNVAVKYIFNDVSDTHKTDIVVEVIERPSLFEQILYTSEIPTHISWDEEVIIPANEDMTFETDYFIMHIEEGDDYSSWLLPMCDEIINYVHELTGWNLSDSGEKFHIFFDTDSYAGRNSNTGNLEMHLQKLYLNPINRRSEERLAAGYPVDPLERQTWVEAILNVFAHEYTHILSHANRTVGYPSWVHEEGNATFIGGVIKERNFDDLNISSTNTIIGDTIVEIISDYAHNRLAYALSRHIGADDLGDAGRSFGAMFYMYIYDNHGGQYAVEVLKTMSEQEPSSSDVLAIINNILGVDVSETFPVWFDENYTDSSEFNIYW